MYSFSTSMGPWLCLWRDATPYPCVSVLEKPIRGKLINVVLCQRDGERVG